MWWWPARSKSTPADPASSASAGNATAGFPMPCHRAEHKGACQDRRSCWVYLFAIDNSGTRNGDAMKEEALALVRDMSDPEQALNRLRDYLQAFVLRSFHESEVFRSLAFTAGGTEFVPVAKRAGPDAGCGSPRRAILERTRAGTVSHVEPASRRRGCQPLPGTAAGRDLADPRESGRTAAG